jgi:hypothetical protein
MIRDSSILLYHETFFCSLVARRGNPFPRVCNGFVGLKKEKY